MTKPLVRIDPPLELGEIGWFRRALAKAITTTQGANADGVCHCVTPNQLREAVRAKRKKKQIIVSAFYYEGNPYGRFLKRAKNGWVLAKKSEKLFRIADWITVPGLPMKSWAEGFGFQNKLVVLRPPVNRANYLRVSEQETKSFYQQTGLKPNAPFFLGRVCLKKDTIHLIQALGTAMPNYQFLFIAEGAKAHKRNKANANTPKNVTIRRGLPFDAFLTGIKNATAYLSLAGIYPDFIYASEAAAAETQIFAFGSKSLPAFTENAISMVREEACIGYVPDFISGIVGIIVVYVEKSGRLYVQSVCI